MPDEVREAVQGGTGENIVECRRPLGQHRAHRYFAVRPAHDRDGTRVAFLDEPGNGQARHRLREHGGESDDVRGREPVLVDEAAAELRQSRPALKDAVAESGPPGAGVVAPEELVGVVRGVGERDLAEEPVPQAAQQVGQVAGDGLVRGRPEVADEVQAQVRDLDLDAGPELAPGQRAELAERERWPVPVGERHVHEDDPGHAVAPLSSVPGGPAGGDQCGRRTGAASATRTRHVPV
jgi:hypothetical protein